MKYSRFWPFWPQKRWFLTPNRVILVKSVKQPQKWIPWYQKHICRGVTLVFGQNIAIFKIFWKMSKIQNGRHFEIALVTFSTSFERANKWIRKLHTPNLQKELVCVCLNKGGIVYQSCQINRFWPFFTPKKGNFGPLFP